MREPTKRNPVAAGLRRPGSPFKKQVVKKATAYTRKSKHKQE